MRLFAYFYIATVVDPAWQVAPFSLAPMPSQALSATCAALSSRGDGAKSTPLQGAVGQEDVSP